MITFGSKVNRCYSLYVPFNNQEIVIQLFFSRNNTYLGFSTDAIIDRMVKDGQVSASIYKDIGDSLFAKTFLIYKDLVTPNLDIKKQFCGIIDDRKEKIQYFTNETIKISKVKTPSGDFENLIYVYAFTLTDYQGSFLYMLAERQHIDNILSKKFVRTCALQISTKNVVDDLIKLNSHYTNQVDDGICRPEIPMIIENPLDSPLRDIFPDKGSINVKRMI